MPSSGFKTCALRSEEHTSELQSHDNRVCRLLLEKKKTTGVGRARRVGGAAACVSGSHRAGEPVRVRRDPLQPRRPIPCRSARFLFFFLKAAPPPVFPLSPPAAPSQP